MGSLLLFACHTAVLAVVGRATHPVLVLPNDTIPVLLTANDTASTLLMTNDTVPFIMSDTAPMLRTNNSVSAYRQYTANVSQQQQAEAEAECCCLAEQADACTFVTEHCANVPALFNYLEFNYCHITSAVQSLLAKVVLVSVLAYALLLLVSTADMVATPLVHIAEQLHMSPGVAGVTLFAWGNGPPLITSHGVP